MLENISYTNANGKTYYGSAALVHRIFNDGKDEYTEAERQADLARGEKLLKQLGYISCDDVKSK